MIGRDEDAQELFERLLALRNDLGLLSEEYDPLAGRLVGNFPQAFSHVSLINSAFRLSGSDPLCHAPDSTRRTASRGGHDDHAPAAADEEASAMSSVHRRAGRVALSRRRQAANAEGEGDMKALTVVPLQAGTAELSDMRRAPASDGPVLVETLAIGDLRHRHRDPLRRATGGRRPGEERLVLGHESLGRVLEAPSGAGLAEGDLVVGIVRRPDPVPVPNCAVLEWDFCRNGQYTERGIKEHDGYCSERYRITPDFVVKVDPGLGILGVLLEPTSVVAKAWEQVDRVGGRAHWDPQTVLITGAGPIGLLAALIGVQRGLDVHVLDQVTEGVKPDLVRDLGATLPHGSAWPTPGRIPTW